MFKMSELTPGDWLWEVDPSSNALRPVMILSTRILEGRGLYNPHTLSGTMIVNNISALSFTDALPKSSVLQSLLTSPLALISWISPLPGMAIRMNKLILHWLEK